MAIDSKDLFTVDKETQNFINFYKTIGVEFIKFTDLLREMNILPKTNIQLKPFLKWVGGKSDILNKMEKYFPSDNNITYIEPFLGGGSVLLNNLEKHYSNYIVSDINKNLILTWNVVKNNVIKLIDELKKLEDKNNKEDYYLIRTKYNETTLNDIETAAYFIYLNKTCFRGIYRVNKNNEFNVPYGNYKNVDFNYNNLINVSKNIQNVSFINDDYKNVINKYHSENSFVYLDPPYFKTFQDYDKNKFDDDEFFQFIKPLKNILVSNSFSFLELFEDKEKLKYEIIETKNKINSKNPTEKRNEILMIL